MTHMDRWSYHIKRFEFDKNTPLLSSTNCNYKLQQNKIFKPAKLIQEKRKHKLKAVGLKV